MGYQRSINLLYKKGTHIVGGRFSRQGLLSAPERNESTVKYVFNKCIMIAYGITSLQKIIFATTPCGNTDMLSVVAVLALLSGV
jgi:hypothetical protein